MLHVAADADIKRASRFTQSALQAVTCMFCQDTIVSSLSIRNAEPFRTFLDPVGFVMRNNEIEKFGHERDIYLSRTWVAVSTVHTVTAPAYLREMSESLCIIPFAL